MLSSNRGPRAYGLILILGVLGLALLAGGAQLARLGGSLYYVVSGFMLLLTAWLAWRRDARAAWGYAAFTLGTLCWAVWETGFYPWAMMPRVIAPALLGLWFAMPWVKRSLRLSSAATAAGPLLLLAAVALIAGGHYARQFKPAASAGRPAGHGTPAASDWASFGGPPDATRFVPAEQINRSNVHALEVAWTYRTKDARRATDPSFANTPFELTPLKIDDSLFLCTPHNVVIAIDADSGEERWRYDPQVDTTGVPHLACRGLSYHAAGARGTCAARLLMGTLDNRLLALDAKTGQPCEDFGVGGSVDLKPGLGLEDFPKGWYYPTSPPLIVGHVAVIGAFILDSQSTDMPSGVVRGYDVQSGKLLWAWDAASPTSIKNPAPDTKYRRSTANFWTVGSANAALGLLFIPTGNVPPDFWAGQRVPEVERYPSSIVALDVETGDVRWHFQTVHHDMWDFDVGSQPVLVDFKTPRGIVPALIAPTKRGEIFVLDQRTGVPLTEVVEKKVPQGAAAGDWTSPTQPYSTGFPSFAPKDLSEADMWGATPLDQLWCRVRFKKSRYEGQFTPQSTQGTVVYAGSFGIIDWGSVSVDPERGLMIVNTSQLPYYQRLIPRIDADRLGVKPYGRRSPGDPPPDRSTFTYFAQQGTPFAIDSWAFLSPVGYPCNQPPWGTVAAVDLNTRTVIWRRPLGTTRDAAPLGIALPTGVFNLGGTVTTRGGVTFVGATVDNYLRAFDTETGRELWEGRLPAGGQANPISYVSGKSGRQFVVIAAGGHPTLRTQLGDYIVAFALPKQPGR